MSRLRGIATGESLGRWTTTAAGTPVGEATRVAVTDPGGVQAEAWVVDREVAPDRRAAMAAHQRRQAQLEGSGHLPVLEVIETPDRLVVIRPATSGQTLEDLAPPLPSATVAAVGVALFQAVQEAGAQLDPLHPRDVVLDTEGRPRLAPLGLPRPSMHRETLAYAAPESFRPDGVASASDAALYGLGAVLYGLSTGQAPAGAARADRPPPVPPGHLRHGLDEALDQAIQHLLSSDPHTRRAALPGLQRAAGPLPDLRVQTVPKRTGEVRYTTTTTQRVAARADDAPGAYVVVPADAWGLLDPRARSAIAGHAEVTLDAADAVVRDGWPVVVSTHRGRAAARQRSSELAQALPGTTLEVVAGGAVPGWLPAVFAAGLALLPGAAGAIALATGWWMLALPLFALAVAVAAAGSVAALGVGRRRGHRRAADEGHERLQAHRRTRGAEGRLDHVWARIARLRIALATQDHLPEPAEHDLRDDLRSLERRLQETADQARVAGRALGQVDAAGLRTRIAALELRAADDEGARRERDRLVRTLADLDAVESQRDAVLADARAIDADLDAIAAAIARSGSGADTGHATLARDAVERREAERRAQAARQREGS